MFIDCSFRRVRVGDKFMCCRFIRCDFTGADFSGVNWDNCTEGYFLDCIFDEGEGPPMQQRYSSQ